MSSIMRFIQPLPAARRSYSSFFSSKPGGGRYFNSAKSTKSVVDGTKTTNKSPRDGTATASGSAAEPSDKSGQKAEGRAAIAPPPSESLSFEPQPHLHPLVELNDLKLNQFFSIHRPLLLLSDPGAILRNAPEGVPLLGSLPAQPSHTQSPVAEELDASYADAETSRQLNRALTMSQVGSATSWDATLHRLGLAVKQDQAGLHAQMAQEWKDIIMDSVKRKRRKKMKKHKRKKRRRLSRAGRQRERGA